MIKMLRSVAIKTENFARSSKRLCLLTLSYFFDLRRYSWSSRYLAVDTQDKLLAVIIANYHVLEKGLSMVDRKDVFGVDVARNLRAHLLEWREKGYPNHQQVEVAKTVLETYEQVISDRNNVEPSEWNPDTLIGGYSYLSKRSTESSGTACFADLVKIRRSIRHFSDANIDEECVMHVVDLAKYSPSACNRQCAEVLWTDNRSLISSILQLQNGNRGFGHNVPGLFIVTANLSAFDGATERNQAWIDAGLFAMSLLYGISSVGMGACPLNWCVTRSTDKKLRKILSIENNKAIVMLIAFGNLNSVTNIANSVKRETKSIIRKL